MARGKDAPAKVGGQIDPYVQRSLQQNKQLAESRLVASMQEAGATTRTGMQESGATQRAGMQATTQRMGIAAQEETADKRAAEDEQGRREDREYQKINADANRKLQKAIADQNIELRRAEMTQDLEAGEKATDLQLDLATIDIAHKMREGKATRNMILSMTKTFKGQEEIKQKKITNFTTAKNEYDQTINVHSQAVTDVGDRLRDDPRMRLDPIPEGGFSRKTLLATQQKTKPFAAIQDQIALKQSKVELDDLRPENIHKVVKQLSEEDLNMMDIRTAWSVIDGSIPIFGEYIKEAEDEDNDLFVGYYKTRRLRLNNIKVSLQGLLSDDTKIGTQEGVTVGSVVLDALGPILGLSMGAEINELVESGVGIGDMSDMLSEGSDPYPPFVVPGLKTKGGQRFLEGINSLLMNQGDIE